MGTSGFVAGLDRSLGGLHQLQRVLEMNQIGGQWADVGDSVWGHKYVTSLGVHVFVRATGIKNLYASLDLTHTLIMIEANAFSL